MRSQSLSSFDVSQGCIELLERFKIPIAGKRAVVVGRSNIVGLPASMLLQNRDATVTVVHSRTPDGPKICAGRWDDDE
jgi:5,10-methylene-tetrahydrofolate dehydrogenase/methenyl tetrahydrofolate cyclohydrolase